MSFKSQAFIGGEWMPASSGETFSVYNPATGEGLSQVSDCGVAEVNQAIDAATAAFETWRYSAVSTRVELLLKIKAGLLARRDLIAGILTRENGKPLAEAKGEVGFAASFFQWFAEEARRSYGDTIPAGTSDKRMYTIRQPAGVAAMITPWNFPIGMIARKVSAAIASGCSCVIKPAEDTPMTALIFAGVLKECEVPAGLVNVVPCSRKNVEEVGKVLSSHPAVRVLSFTGSTAVGKMLYRQAAQSMKKLSMELGGDAPFIVFPSADMKKVIKGAMASKFRNTGQTCVTANRFFVHSSVMEKFVSGLKEAMEKELLVGDGSAPGVNLGPIINQRQHQRVCRIVDVSVKMGAKIVVGGGPKEGLFGLFYQPTILTNVTEEMPAFKEEIFGPVVAIMTFEKEEEAVRLANKTSMGLAGFFFTGDLNQSVRVAEALEVGMVGVNEGLVSTCEAPFGGFKQSGLGKEGSRHGLDEYSDLKYVCINVAP